MNTPKKLTSILLSSLAGIGILIACGPYFAPRLFHYKNTVIENQPTGVDLMFPDNIKPAEHHIQLRNLPNRLLATYNTDIADLKLAAPKLPQKTVDKYSAIRSDMIITAWDQPAVQLGNQRPITWLDEATLAAIPKEFSIYLRGAVAYRSGLTDKARKHWLEVLQLPAAERSYKTIWAAWMLARTSTKDGEAMLWYEKVKQFKKQGFPDSLNVTGKDWTSFFSLKSGDFTTALDIYIKEGRDQTTDPVTSANHINQVFYSALDRHQNEPSKAFSLFAGKKDHSLAMSYFLSRLRSPYLHNKDESNAHASSRTQLELWIKALRKSKRADIDKELGICAATAYSIHDEKNLHACLKAMKQPTTESLWLQAKLATLKGKLNKAATIYQQAIDSIKKEGVTTETLVLNYYEGFRENGQIANDRYFNLYSEYASVELGLKHYGKALDLFILAKNHSDAAYIAETLLSSVELLDYVRNSKIAQKSEWIKALLTRKLMRHEYFKDAKKFALDKHLNHYNSYINHYRIGINEKIPKNNRAESFVTAAKILRRHGHELFYLENDCRPFLRIHAAERKIHDKYDLTDAYPEPLPTPKDFIPKISSDELKRIKQNYVRISPVSTKDRHAAELLHRAAALLPDNDDQTALLLWQAGDWTRTDPKIADKYYQALVRRCPKTFLGKACDERRWFLHAHELRAH